MDKYEVIRRPLITEKCVDKKEEEATLVFEVARDANKTQVKAFIFLDNSGQQLDAPVDLQGFTPDEAMGQGGFGWPMGPFILMDMIGIDVSTELSGDIVLAWQLHQLGPKRPVQCVIAERMAQGPR